MDIVAVVIFLVALAVIGVEWVHRTKVALTGAALMVLVGVLDQENAIEAIDWATLGLPTGMVVLNRRLDRADRDLHVSRLALPRWTTFRSPLR